MAQAQGEHERRIESAFSVSDVLVVSFDLLLDDFEIVAPKIRRFDVIVCVRIPAFVR